MPKRPPWPTATLASPLLFVALQGCASPMTSSDTPATYPPPGHYPPTLNRLVDGPFRFWRHNLGVYCFSTWGCRAEYGPHLVHDAPDDEWQPPVEEFPGDIRARMRATYLGYRNFEGPLHLRWNDRDKQALQLDLDLAGLFADGLIRHNVPESEILPTSSVGDPGIVIEVDDRTVRVYMRALIPLKQPRDPRNRYTNAVDENVLVYEQTL